MVNPKKLNFVKPTVEQCIDFLEACKERTYIYDDIYPNANRLVVEDYACLSYFFFEEVIKLLRDREDPAFDEHLSQSH